MMKKMMALIAALTLAASLTACGGHCKSCDQKVYKDGYCEYRYALNTAQDMVGSAAQNVLGGLFG